MRRKNTKCTAILYALTGRLTFLSNNVDLKYGENGGKSCPTSTKIGILKITKNKQKLPVTILFVSFKNKT